jgi:DNA-binding IclR family transcriptional regulator
MPNVSVGPFATIFGAGFQGSEKESAGRAGTQSIERAIGILNAVALRGRSGWGLSELSEHCGLDHSTMHRILACLVRGRLLLQNPYDRRYLPGPLLFELSLSVPHYASFVERCSRSLARIAREYHGVASLVLRSGYEGVIAARIGQERFLTFNQIGKRKPLVALLGGVAILLSLEPKETDRIVRHNFTQIKRMEPDHVAAYKRMYMRSRRAGYAIYQGEVTPELSGVAVAIPSTDGCTVSALCAAGEQTEYTALHKRNVFEALREEAVAIMREISTPGRH